MGHRLGVPDEAKPGENEAGKENAHQEDVREGHDIDEGEARVLVDRVADTQRRLRTKATIMATG